MKFTFGLSESPASVLTELYPRESAEKELSLEEFLDKLPDTIDRSKNSAGSEDLIGNLME